MRAYAEELARHAPEPFRWYEISGDEIIVRMPAPRAPGPRVHRLARAAAAGPTAPGGAGRPYRGRSRGSFARELRRPDLIVVPEAVFAETTMAPFHPRDVALVGEIVSPSNHSTDCVEKMHDYPAMGIPLYLLIDARKGTIAALSDPGSTQAGTGLGTAPAATTRSATPSPSATGSSRRATCTRTRKADGGTAHHSGWAARNAS